MEDNNLDLIPYREGDKWGYSDVNGNIVIDCLYKEVELFSVRAGFAKGLARVKIADEWQYYDTERGSQRYHSCIGYVNKNGTEIIPCIYQKIDWSYFNLRSPLKNLALVELDGKLGIIDSTGREICACIYDSIQYKHDNILEVRFEKKSGYVDLDGHILAPCIYYLISNLYDSSFSWANITRSHTYKSEKYGVIDRYGKLVCACIYTDSIHFYEGRAKVRLNGKWGFIDEQGNPVCPCMFDDVERFKNGMARVRLGDKFGYIDRSGRQIIPCIYYFAGNYSEGLAKVCLEWLKWGFIDTTGRIVVSLIYEQTSVFWGGRAIVRQADKFGVIDRAGQVIIPYSYYENAFNSELWMYGQEINPSILSRFRDAGPNFFITKAGGGYSCYDYYGRLIIPCKYESVYWSSFFNAFITDERKDDSIESYTIIGRNGLQIGGTFTAINYAYSNEAAFAKVMVNNKWGLIDKNGNLLMACNYDEIEEQQAFDPLLWVRHNGKWGLADKYGNEVVPCIYETTGKYGFSRNFSEGALAVKLDGKYGFVDDCGKPLCDFIYDYAEGFQNGYARVTLDNKWGFIDKNGTQIIDCIYDYADAFSQSASRVCQDGKWGYINSSGKEIIPCIHKRKSKHSDDDADFFLVFSDGMACIQDVAEPGKTYKWGYADIEGNIVIPFVYGDAANFEQGVAKVKTGGKNGYIGKNGRQYWNNDGDSAVGYKLKAYLHNNEKQRQQQYRNMARAVEDMRDAMQTALAEESSLQVVPQELVPFRDCNKWGFSTRSGEPAINCIYDECGMFRDGLAVVSNNNKWGYVDINGTEIIALMYDEVGEFENGLAKVKLNGKYGYIDKNGTIYWRE